MLNAVVIPIALELKLTMLNCAKGLHCPRTPTNDPTVAGKLMRGMHPYRNVLLATSARRLTMRDAGYIPDGSATGDLSACTAPSVSETMAHCVGISVFHEAGT